jgi:hypothetical protein
MNAWWISFYVPDEHFGEFELHSPWWVSGYGDEETIVVAAIRADNEEAAWQRVIDAFDDEAHYRERFCEPLDRDDPFVDRFPQGAWMDWSDHATCRCGSSFCDGANPQISDAGEDDAQS